MLYSILMVERYNHQELKGIEAAAQGLVDDAIVVGRESGDAHTSTLIRQFAVLMRKGIIDVGLTFEDEKKDDVYLRRRFDRDLQRDTFGIRFHPEFPFRKTNPFLDEATKSVTPLFTKIATAKIRGNRRVSPNR